MKVKLLRDARINHKAGEIVEVSPVVAEFLRQTRTAVNAPAEVPKTTTRKATTKK